jgi:hypothetical protein
MILIYLRWHNKIELVFGIVFGYMLGTNPINTEDIKKIFSRDNNSTEIVKEKKWK